MSSVPNYKFVRYFIEVTNFDNQKCDYFKDGG
jgi:hypothetical protein